MALELVKAVRASLRFLDLGPDRITVPILAAVYRAAAAGADSSGCLTGETGAFKTELAALAQQHYGQGMNSRNLPASWLSTGNAAGGAGVRRERCGCSASMISPRPDRRRTCSGITGRRTG